MRQELRLEQVRDFTLVGGPELLQTIHCHDADVPLHVFAHDRVHANGARDSGPGVAIGALFAQAMGSCNGAEHDFAVRFTG